ncbi:hypothetical protein [Romboutsia sp.]|uniref:hypothetical protein n=1 Tax=Romboutsia sp. TaxID=1965302 RepID=UPI003F3BDDBB
MNKILTLYYIEFKRIYKLFFGLLGFLFVGNLGILGLNIFRILSNEKISTNTKFSLAKLSTPNIRRLLLEYELKNIYYFTNLLLGLAVIFVLIYAIAIWYRDFVGKSKTSYTLFMLPTNRFNIYIAKLITIVVMIYGVMLTQILCWGVELVIISSLSKLKIPQMISVFTRGVLLSGDLRLIQTYFMDFFMINLVGVILAVIVIFTGVMIERAYKKKGIILGVMYIGLSILIYCVLISLSNYSDRFLLAHSIYYILLFALSIKISYQLITNKVYM